MKRSSRTVVLLAALAGFCTAARAAIETYKIDPVHSSIGFSIRHFLTEVPGNFTEFSGMIKVDRDDLTNSSVDARIAVKSIDTRVSMRDNDLRSGHFFDVAKYPAITFKSTSWTETGHNTFDVAGKLTIRDVVRTVVLKVKCLGFGRGVGGKKICGWRATATLNRNDFGITRYPAMLGSEVAVTINIEADLEH